MARLDPIDVDPIDDPIDDRGSVFWENLIIIQRKELKP